MGQSGNQTGAGAAPKRGEKRRQAAGRPARRPAGAVSYTLRESYGAQDLEDLLAQVFAAEADRAAGRTAGLGARGLGGARGSAKARGLAEDGG